MRNKIFLIGNGFDIAHRFKTSFSDFALSYLNKLIIPQLIDAIKTRKTSHPLFKEDYTAIMSMKGGGAFVKENPEDVIWHYAQSNRNELLTEYIANDYSVLSDILQNDLLSKLYMDTNKNWFDIENTYFNELIPLKDSALKNPDRFKTDNLDKLNNEFEDIKLAVTDYLRSLKIEPNLDIENFFSLHLKDVDNTYVVNFNYTSTVKMYLEDSGKITVNHIHGCFEDDNIIFGYGNDQSSHYQEMKDSGIDGFLRFFKTFDYLKDVNYDRIYSEAVDKFDGFEVFVVGHSLGMTDKTLLSEIFNEEKCKKIHLFKRSDYKNEPQRISEKFRDLTYSASRILTDERLLRKKIVNLKESRFFPN